MKRSELPLRPYLVHYAGVVGSIARFTCLVHYIFVLGYRIYILLNEMGSMGRPAKGLSSCLSSLRFNNNKYEEKKMIWVDDSDIVVVITTKKINNK